MSRETIFATAVISLLHEYVEDTSIWDAIVARQSKLGAVNERLAMETLCIVSKKLTASPVRNEVLRDIVELIKETSSTYFLPKPYLKWVVGVLENPMMSDKTFAFNALLILQKCLDPTRISEFVELRIPDKIAECLNCIPDMSAGITVFIACVFTMNLMKVVYDYTGVVKSLKRFSLTKLTREADLALGDAKVGITKHRPIVSMHMCGQDALFRLFAMIMPNALAKHPETVDAILQTGDEVLIVRVAEKTKHPELVDAVGTMYHNIQNIWVKKRALYILRMPKLCLVCGEVTKLKCGGCFTARYCSYECQKSAFRAHKAECKACVRCWDQLK